MDTSLFPYASWARISREVISRDPQLLQRGQAQGDAELRQTLAAFLREYRGVCCRAEQIVVGAGLEYLLSVLVQLLPEKSVFAVEDPGYGALWQTLRNHRRRMVPIPVDGGGMQAEALVKSRAQIAYVTPSHQFPMGSTMPVGRRSRLLQWAAAKPGRYLIEDDYDSEFRYASRPIPAMQGMDPEGRVIYIGTFSRSIAPGIRAAYLVLPEALLPVYGERFGFAASTVSRFEQQTLRLFLEQGLYGRHLRRMTLHYRKKQQLLTQELRRRFPGAELAGQMTFRTINGLSAVILQYYSRVYGRRQPELLTNEGDITRMLDANNVAWQIGEMGRLDLGGGGTIAKYVANRGIKVLDMGVPVLSMHSPFEVIHKTDLYMAYRTFSVFCQSAD